MSHLLKGHGQNIITVDKQSFLVCIIELFYQSSEIPLTYCQQANEWKTLALFLRGGMSKKLSTSKS